MRAALTALALCACGGPPVFECKRGPFASFVMEQEGQCENATRAADIAGRMLVDAFVISPDELARERSRTHVYVHAVNAWNTFFDGQVAGYTWLDTVETDNRGESFLHEELHRIQIDRFEEQTTTHTGWKDHGWFGLADFHAHVITRGARRVHASDMTPHQLIGLRGAGWSFDGVEP